MLQTLQKLVGFQGPTYVWGKLRNTEKEQDLLCECITILNSCINGQSSAQPILLMVQVYGHWQNTRCASGCCLVGVVQQLLTTCTARLMEARPW